MKKLLSITMAVAAAALLPTPFGANARASVYISLYADLDHTVCRVDAAVPQVIEVWAFAHNASSGILSGGFKMSHPEWVDINIWEMNPDNANLIGCPSFGPGGAYWCITFNSCQTSDWVWLYKFTFTIVTAGLQGSISVDDSEVEPNYKDCVSAPPIDLTIYSNLRINEDCVLGARLGSWGAIKALYR